MRETSKTNLLKKALELVRRKRIVSVDLLARELKVDRATAETIIATLMAEGYIVELRGDPCKYCPLAPICNPERRRACPYQRTKVYIVRERKG